MTVRFRLKGQDWSWQRRAACAGRVPVSEFFRGQGRESAKMTKLALARLQVMCDDCPVQVECEQHAEEYPEFYGLWGGKSEAQRRKERRERSAKAAGRAS